MLEFGGLEHCVKAGTGSSDTDPESAPVRPLSSSPARDQALSRRLRTGGEVTADGKTCVNNANKYAPHFLRFAPGSDERNARVRSALNDGDAGKLPDADPAKASGTYKLGVADKPATDAMEEGGQYQRLLVAIVVFVGELGAFCLLGALSVGVILAQVLLLLLLAFAPVALVAAVIPGRGHDFFKGWLAKLAGYLLRKAAYSLILAVLLAVSAALASAPPPQLGWLMSFGLQALFFWAVFLQRKTLAESLIGIATGPTAPGRESTLRVLGLYYGRAVAARTSRRPLRRGAGRSGRSGCGACRRRRTVGERRSVERQLCRRSRSASRPRSARAPRPNPTRPRRPVPPLIPPHRSRLLRAASPAEAFPGASARPPRSGDGPSAKGAKPAGPEKPVSRRKNAAARKPTPSLDPPRRGPAATAARSRQRGRAARSRAELGAERDSLGASSAAGKGREGGKPPASKGEPTRRPEPPTPPRPRKGRAGKRGRK